MLGETAALVHGFDLALLEDVANRIGPSIEEVAKRIEAGDWPLVPNDTVAHIFIAGMVPLSALGASRSGSHPHNVSVVSLGGSQI